MSFCASPRAASICRLLLVEQLLRLVAIALGAIDRVLERLLSLLDRAENGGERLPAEQKVQNAEDDQRPEHQIDPKAHERTTGLPLRLLGEKRRARCAMQMASERTACA